MNDDDDDDGRDWTELQKKVRNCELVSVSAGIFIQKGTTTTRSVVKNEIVYEIFRNTSLFKMPIELK